MSGLRAPLTSFRFYGPNGEDVTEAVLAAAGAAAGARAASSGCAAADGGPSSSGAGVVAETSVFHASGGGAAHMAADMQVRPAYDFSRDGLFAALRHPSLPLGGQLSAVRWMSHMRWSGSAQAIPCQHVPRTFSDPTLCTGAIPGQRAVGPSPEPRWRGRPLCV